MPDDPTPPTTTTTEPPEPTREGADDAASLRSEAAARRRQLRDVEAERDAGYAERDERIAALTDRLDRRDRAEVEALAADRLEDPRDLWRGDVELDALRNEDGDVDHQAVSAAVGALLADRPHYANRERDAARQRQRDAQGRLGVNEPEAPSFGAALKGAR